MRAKRPSPFTNRPSPEEELELKRAKHAFVQWLVSGNRRVVPPEAKAFLKASPKDARDLFDHFRKRTRQRTKGKKYLFPK